MTAFKPGHDSELVNSTPHASCVGFVHLRANSPLRGVADAVGWLVDNSPDLSAGEELLHLQASKRPQDRSRPTPSEPILDSFGGSQTRSMQLQDVRVFFSVHHAPPMM